MNNIKSFSFYRNYFELLRYLPDDERLKLYDAMLEYIFEDKEPQLERLSKGIWLNLKMPLDTSKNNGGRGGRPKKEEADTETELKPIENQKETEKKTNNNFLFLISNYLYLKDKGLLREKIEEWLEYKKQRKDKQYTEIGFKKLLKQIENNVNIYGEQAIVNLIDECMGNNYQGIIFDKLKKQNKNIQNNPAIEPDWFNKDVENKQMTDEDLQEFDDLLKNMN